MRLPWAEEAFQEVGWASQRMQRDVELVVGEAQLDIFRQQSHHLGFQRAPGGLKGGKALKGFRPGWCFEDGVRSGRDLLAPQPPRLLKRQGRLGRRVSR